MTHLKFFFGCTVAIFLYSFISPTSEWYKYQDKDCEILFPKVPNNDTIVKEISIGKLIANRIFLNNNQAENDSNIVYELMETSYPSPNVTDSSKEFAEHVFHGAVSSSLKRLNGNLISEKDITLDGYYGKDVKFSFDKDTKMVKMRCYVAKGKVYAVETIALSGKENNLNAVTFFESFKLK